jgi:hypothetical protein
MLCPCGPISAAVAAHIRLGSPWWILIFVSTCPQGVNDVQDLLYSPPCSPRHGCRRAGVSCRRRMEKSSRSRGGGHRLSPVTDRHRVSPTRSCRSSLSFSPPRTPSIAQMKAGSGISGIKWQKWQSEGSRESVGVPGCGYGSADKTWMTRAI